MSLAHHSKFLSYVLRHCPDVVGLELGPGGWVPVDRLLEGAENAGHPLDREILREVVATSDKQRFAFSGDGTLIRANQGHSVEVDLQLEPVVLTVRALALHEAGVPFFVSANGVWLVVHVPPEFLAF